MLSKVQEMEGKVRAARLDVLAAHRQVDDLQAEVTRLRQANTELRRQLETWGLSNG